MILIQASRNVGIVGTGSYVPEKVVTNFDLEKMVETSDEWIKTRTGIEQRRIAEENMPTSEIAYIAGKRAIEDAGLTPEDIDLIIVATITPDMYSPSTACRVQAKLGASKAAAFDVNAACTGLIYGLTVASQFILTGYYKNALVIGADELSRILEWTDRNTCVLFGDGAGAVVLQAVDNGYGILSTNLGADGSMGDVLTIPSCYIPEHEKEKRKPENYRTIWMDGSEVFKFAVRVMANATNRALDDLNLDINDVNLIVPHQANIRIIEGAAKRLGVSVNKIYSNIHRYGNMSAASIAVALDEAVKEGRINKGDLIVLVGFGGGLTWGSAIVRWSK